MEIQWSRNYIPVSLAHGARECKAHVNTMFTGSLATRQSMAWICSVGLKDVRGTKCAQDLAAGSEEEVSFQTLLIFLISDKYQESTVLP